MRQSRCPYQRNVPHFYIVFAIYMIDVCLLALRVVLVVLFHLILIRGAVARGAMAETEVELQLQQPSSSTEAPRLTEKTEEELQLPQPPLEVAVDIDKIVVLKSINNKLNDHHRDPQRLQPCTIYRVRESIRNENPKAYQPQVVAIGPYHRGDTLLLPMERLKKQFLRDLISHHETNTVEKYIEALSDPSFVDQANKCYSEPVILSEKGKGNAFVEMMVFDGCFIIEFLVKSVLEEDMGELDFVNWNRPVVENDLLLLENQIPLSVLKVLYSTSDIPSLNEKFGPMTLEELALMYISRERVDNVQPTPPVVHHLLHLRHSSLAPPAKANTAAKLCTFRSVTKLIWSKIQNFLSYVFFWLLSVFLTCRRPPRYKRSKKAPRAMPNASGLHDSGIKFEVKETSCMLDVTFRTRDGVMEMPRLPIQALTVSQFRNLVAFEQCCPDVGSHFTAYVALMDNLIDEAKDVALLKGSGVLESKLGAEDEVAKFFNSLGKGAHLNYDKHYLVELFKDVKEYCSTERNKWRAKLVQDYFGNPWATVSLIAAFVLLLLTLCQTFFAVFAYFRPPPSGSAPAPA